MSFSEQGLINFRNIERLQDVAFSYDVSPDKPGVSCAFSPTMLLYDNWFKSEHVTVQWLDCSGSTPELSLDHNTTFVMNERCHALDLCCIKWENKDILVVATSHGKVYAYDLCSHLLEWEAQYDLGLPLKVQSLASDGHGIVFVCDRNNNAVHMFSPYGAYVKTIVDPEEHGVSELRFIRWSSKISAFVTAHKRDNAGWQIIYKRSMQT